MGELHVSLIGWSFLTRSRTNLPICLPGCLAAYLRTYLRTYLPACLPVSVIGALRLFREATA
jgi:hypothetical protein